MLMSVGVEEFYWVLYMTCCSIIRNRVGTGPVDKNSRSQNGATP